MTDDIESFRAWATQLGCPPEAIPSEEALKSVYRTRLRGVFENMVRRVQPRQEVQAVRENILIEKMKKLKQQALEPGGCISMQACSRSFLPKELQTYVKFQDLEKKKESTVAHIEEQKKEYETLAAAIKAKNIQYINLSQKRETLNAKVNLLAFKSELLDRKLKVEEENKQKIMSAMPVRLTAQNASENQAMDSVKKALQLLDKFYEFHDNNDDPQALQQCKEELWQQMRDIFAKLPNFLFFNAIMRLMDEQIQHIMSLSGTTQGPSSAHSLAGFTPKKPLTAFDMKLMRTKVELLGMVVKFVAARKERSEAEERFSEAYGPFVEALQKKVQLFNADIDDHSDEVISKYIIEYNSRNFNKSQNEFLSQQIEFYKQEIDRGAKQLENHEVMLGTVKQVYSDINDSINRIHHDMLQFSQIKEKIIYSKNIMKHMLDDMHATASSAAVNAKSNFLPTTLKISNSNSPGSTHSFELGGSDTVFCSTKLDFDSTITSLNSTVRRSPSAGNTTLMPAASGINEGRCTLPPHALELNTFAEISLEKFSCMPKKCAFYLSPNPLVLEPRALCSTMQLIPGSLLTPFGALQEVRNRILWAELIAKHSQDMKLNLNVLIVDPATCKQKMKNQHQAMEELLDKIDITHSNTRHTLDKLRKLYKFMLDNPLRHYIPARNTFNERSYADYEAEFTMYYRMATIGTSVKA